MDPKEDPDLDSSQYRACSSPTPRVLAQQARPFRTSLHWVPCQHGQVPQQAVIGGMDVGGELLYVCRAPHNGDTIPGKVVSSHGGAYVGWGLMEHKKDQYEVLTGCVGCVGWAPGSNGSVPHGAVPAGRTANNETLYVGRFSHQGTLTPGKVQKSHGRCYIPYGGGEAFCTTYEVLVFQD